MEGFELHHHAAGMSSTYTEMEGNLHIRAKNMNMWKTRRFVLTGQVLQYFSLKKPGQKRMLEAFAGLALSSSKKKSSENDHIFELVQCSIKPIHEYLSNRPHSFQIASTSFFLLLHADSHEEMQAWVSRLRLASKGGACSPPSDRGVLRTRSYSGGAMSPSPSSARITVVAESSEDDILEFAVLHRSDIHALLAHDHGRYVGHHWIVQTAMYLGGKQVPRGSILIAVNGSSIPSDDDMSTLRRRVHSARCPLTVHFLRCRPKVGVLKMQHSYDALGSMLKLTTRGTALMGWKDLACEIDGDLFVCARLGGPAAAGSTAALAKWGHALLQSGNAAVADSSSTDKPALKSTTVVSLSDGHASVRLVHAVLSGRPHCFLLTTASMSLLLQAASDDDMVEWMGALVHAIDLAQGHVVAGGSSSTSHPLSAFSRPHVRRNAPEATTTQQHPPHRTPPQSFFPPSGGDGIQRSSAQSQSLIFDPQPPQNHPSPLPRLAAADVVEILMFCQHHGRYTEALQLLVQHTSCRLLYWPSIFAWALPHPVVTAQEIAAYSTTPISDEYVDTIQLLKDIPRTATWLASSDGAPASTVDAPPTRLTNLGTVLRAFIAHSCSNVDAAISSSHTSYLQGMNGIAFVLLQVLADDVDRSFQFLHGLVHGALPTIFHSEAHSTNALVQTGATLESMVSMYLPALAATFEVVGLPVFLLAYKWFPTLFSDVSLEANREHNQLRYDTLLVAWDVCMLVGVEGIYVVALALFAAADVAIRNLGRTCLAEDVSGAFTAVLAHLTPDDFVLHVCEVIETCRHPLLLQMRDAHHRKLHESVMQRPSVVTTLDTGQVVGGSAATPALVPHASADSALVLPPPTY
ncbi:hypothetical protein DYB25_006951 [Aphanomyces astaci]|uniref:PH domain-containing protein n=1 Tax=Aphanomyces astaci TaxID=112090 RepID=A0A397BF01_APHAT|nr:hypothetical protein DYB25_006951 [Aphanomyces astaci]RHY40270.1 hypothetical protein DYB30_005442 [Aphanomyces astaci]RHZ40852.1 hypothetical protein DYB31_005516 [Aphanomyces astaci]